jgi:hypothetical protein
VGLQQFLDPSGQHFALVKDSGQRAGQARDDQRCRVGAGNDHGLFVERGEDVFDQALGHPRCLWPHQADQSSSTGLADLGRQAESLQQGEYGRVLDARAKDRAGAARESPRRTVHRPP